MSVERLDVHRPVPSGAHDLRQTLGVILVGLVHLHLERGARVPGVETGDIEAARAQFMHEPWRHRPGLDPKLGILSRMPPYDARNLLRIGRTLAAPKPRPGLVNNTDPSQLL